MQDRIIVDFNALSRISRKLRSAGQEMDEAMTILSGLYLAEENGADLRLYGCNCSLKSIGTSVGAYNVSSAVSNYRSAIRRLGDYSDSLAVAISDLADDFRRMESGIAGDAGTLAQNGNSSGSKDESSWDWSSFWSNFWKLISSGGIVGPSIATIGQLFTGGISFPSVFKALGYTSKAIAQIAKGASKSSFDWFGLLSADKKTLGESFQSQLDDLNFGCAKNVSDRIKTGAKWAGHIITIVTTGYDNIWVNEEGNSTGRAIAETVGESAVKIVGGIALGALIGACGAPALVAGVAVSAIWIAGDAISEAITGKDVAELVSDTVLDGIESISNSIGDAAQKAGNAISGWWNSIADKPLFA